MNLKYIWVNIALLLVQLTQAQNFKGQLRDNSSNEPLVGAHIIAEGGMATYTDTEGNFELQIEENGTVLIFSSIGYQMSEHRVLPGSRRITFFIEQAPIRMTGVLVTGNSKTDPVHISEANDYVKKVVQPKNVADLFGDINGFSLIKRGNYAIDPSFRASQYEQLNVQFDGGTKVMHACPNRMDPITTHVIPEEIEKIEIVKGPYTVRYGPTFAGIINMVTHSPTAKDHGLSGSIDLGYESNGNSYISMARLQQASEMYDLVGNLGYRAFGNFRDGENTEIPSSFRSFDYGLRVGYNLNPSQRLQAHWRQSYGRDVLHAGLPMDTEEDNSSVLSVDYRLKHQRKIFKGVQAKGYYGYVDHIMSNTDRPTFMMTEAVSTVDALTVGGKVELHIQPTTHLSMYLGTDFLHVAREGERTRIVKRNGTMTLPSPTVFVDNVWQNSFIDDTGFFWENKYLLSEKTVLTAGLRYDLVSSDIKDPASDFKALYPDLTKRTEHNFSATISTKYILSERFLLELAYGRGVRSANMIERAINHFTVGQDPYEYIGNPNLRAEVNNQFEVGFKGKVPISSTDFNRLFYETSFYYSCYENYIVPIIDKDLVRKYMPAQEPRNPKVFRNLNGAYKTGLELTLGLNLRNHWSFTSELAYVYAKNKDLGESLPLVPPLTTRFKLGYEVAKFWANATYTITARQGNIASTFGERPTPGYEIMDLRFGMRVFHDLTLGAAALNLFDTTYYNHLNFSFSNQSGFQRLPINDPGRNLTLFAQYKF